MFAHYNGRLNIAVPNRCGHTSMCDYFNLPYIDNPDLFKEWSNGPGVKVLVLRHPIARLNSSRNLFNFLFSEVREHYEQTSNIEECKSLLVQKFAKINAPSTDSNTDALLKHYVSHPTSRFDNLFIYYGHSQPYLVPNNNFDYNFKHIKFERLGEYINVQRVTTNTTSQDSFEFDDNNGFYSKDELLAEVDAYYDALANTEELSVEQWKNDTGIAQ